MRQRRNFTKVVLSVILAAAVCAGSALAQDVTFQASVDKNPVGVDDQFTLSLALSNAGMGGAKNLQLPDLSKFRIMSGPNQSSSMQFVNGAVSSSVVFSYVLQPKEVGDFTLGAASVEAGGKTYHSNTLAIKVVKGSPKPKQQAANGAGGDAAVQLGDNLFLRAVINKTHVMQGEQINLVFKLYTRVSVVNVAVEKSPTMTGFWGEDEDTKDISLSNEVINGKQYRVGTIKRTALFPTQSGTLEISPMTIQTTVQIQNRSADPFDAFFRDPFGRNVNYEVTSEPVKIKVDPLPSGAPPDFKGAVGRFAMSTAVDKKSTRTNEPIGLKVTISGTGNIKLLESPAVELPNDFEQYTPKVSDNISRANGVITGSKTFDYLLIPRYPGLKIIKPVTFSYYDLGKKEYVRLRSPQIELNVEQGAATPASMASGASREDVRMLSQDIRFIKVGQAAFTRPGEHLYTSPMFAALMLLPLAGLAGAFVYARQRQAVLQDEAGYRNRRAMRVAQKGLKQAAYLLKESSGSPNTKQRIRFYAEVSRALWKYLGDKLNIPQSDFSVEGATGELARRGVVTDLQQSLQMLLETCDMARFAPTSMGLTTMEKTYEEARRIIVELERTLKSS